MSTLRAGDGPSAPCRVRSGAAAWPARVREAWLRPGGRAWGQAVLASLLCTSLTAAAVPGPEAPPLAAAYHAPTDARELLRIDEPMRQFFAARILPHRASADRLRALLDAIHQPGGLGFTYDREITYDPRETFRRRRGNCVGYSFLVVALAREFGFKASFQDVATPLQWDRIGSLVVSVRHMNVRVDLGDEYYLIDLQPEFLSVTASSTMTVIKDERAFAKFYGSAGFFALLRGQVDEAMQYMVLATTTDPEGAQGWANRASMHSYRGELTQARACFERSLQLDPRDLFALEGYVGILQRLGTKEDLRIAARYERRAQTVRDHNPYYQQGLARRASEQGDWVTAEKRLHRAISLKGDEPQFHEQRVKALQQLGREDEARRATAKLEKLRRRLATEQAQHAP